ncbi:hypothetical protein JCM4814A_18440 [Streptomyces phaeofaciens JCM 4814]|uniref:Uncharacterized protein n=1 Tax=Streptomyces phaeofaciens TaxID=68254 RepID=A0A918LV30_9ACTN|nr:hypothetical protein [Streptomyces phaeofaciens]GGT57792.1 hypothetical protein GCM10010226_38920 [Streptomyces phaeofaciens]
MSDHTNRPNSVVLIAALLAVLVGAEVAVVTSDLADGPRYAIGGAILVGLIAGAFQLSRARRTSR